MRKYVQFYGGKQFSPQSFSQQILFDPLEERNNSSIHGSLPYESFYMFGKHI